jgi:hypothetical protein
LGFELAHQQAVQVSGELAEAVEEVPAKNKDESEGAGENDEAVESGTTVHEGGGARADPFRGTQRRGRSLQPGATLSIMILGRKETSL